MGNYDKLIERTKHSRWKKGQSGNHGGWSKTTRELKELARSHVAKAFERARQILDDDDAEWRAWMDAGRFVASYGIGAPPKAEVASADELPDDPVTQLDAEELRALARQSLADEAAPDAGDDDSDDTVN